MENTALLDTGTNRLQFTLEDSKIINDTYNLYGNVCEKYLL